MFTKIGTIGVGVSDQDKALDFYVNTLGFEKIDDQPMSETERWLEVAPPGAQTHIMLGLRSQSGGDKTGFTGYVLNTDNIEETCETLKARGVTLSKELSTEPWGKWAQFTDADGNEFGTCLVNSPPHQGFRQKKFYGSRLRQKAPLLSWKHQCSVPFVF